MTVLVDTSAIVALLDPSDRRGVDARSWLVEHAATPLITHNYVLAESFAVLERRFGRASVIDLRDTVLPALEVVWVDPDQHELAFDAHLAASRQSSFVDQVTFQVMRDERIGTAFALDGDFARAGFITVP